MIHDNQKDSLTLLGAETRLAQIETEARTIQQMISSMKFNGRTITAPTRFIATRPAKGDAPKVGKDWAKGRKLSPAHVRAILRGRRAAKRRRDAELLALATAHAARGRTGTADRINAARTKRDAKAGTK